MTAPATPRDWLSWAASVADSYHRTHSPRLKLTGWTDRRLNDSRETAISIIRLAERSANGNRGASLLFAYYVEDVSWHSFTPKEQTIIKITARTFAKALREAGFLDGKG